MSIIRSEQAYIEDISAADAKLIKALCDGNAGMAAGCLHTMAVMIGIMLDTYGEDYDDAARRRVCANLARTVPAVAAQHHAMDDIEQQMFAGSLDLFNQIMDEQGFPELKTSPGFETFKIYTRGLLAKIANAKIAPYPHAPHIQETVIAWNPDETMPLDYYPVPENITHVKTAPPGNPLFGGNYAFKDALRILFERAGAWKTLQPLAQYMRNNEFEITMRQKPRTADQAEGINALFIRYNGANLSEKIGAMTGIDDEQLDQACRLGCRANNVEISRLPSAAP